MTQTTKVAPRTANRNFAYDDEAYHEVKRNLGRLIDAGQLRPAMQLALGLMKQGSYQVEMSDEGLMAQDIEDCLRRGPQGHREVRPACERSHRPVLGDARQRSRGLHRPGAPSGAAKARPGGFGTINPPRGIPLQREPTVAQHSPRPSALHPP